MYNFNYTDKQMIKLKKTLLLIGISTFMLSSTAFAEEITELETENNSEAIISETQTENVQQEETSPQIRQGYVTVDVLNVRNGASTDYEKLGQVFLGNRINVVNESNNWYEIEFNGATAYVAAEYIKIVDPIALSQQNMGNQIVEYAKTFIGVPYASGGESPSGFDCSGFVKYIMGNYGVTMPRISHDQYSIGVRVDKSELMPGDLVFFKYSSSSYRISHVGIYVGDGSFIHSPVPGQAVKISPMNTGYFANYYYGATRVFY